ncbi:vacuolar protein sorting-associated protein 33 [[Candida] jaroonii]|uniref:Vacuolar protein sorting-associated protein 33 n=1 Tax=[Candida] jaroonii TaxID=467808 RepID=A0ACA9Y115_9ASCO|nr:vacuolar protein sorting-associated protein 33 [[Candida] jaroonii]
MGDITKLERSQGLGDSMDDLKTSGSSDGVVGVETDVETNDADDLDLFGFVNNTVINDLFDIFDKIYSSDHLLVLDKALSPLINYLVPFKTFKQRGKFDKVIWLGEDIIEHHQNIIIIADNNTKFNIPDHSRVTVIVKNLSKSKLYEINQATPALNLDLNDIINNDLKFVRGRNIKIYNWQVNGITINGILSLQDNKCMKNYFNEPVKQINELNDGLVNLIDKEGIKINNIYSIGNNSEKLIDNFNVKKNQYLNYRMNNLQQEFYLNKMKPTHNLIVVERNIDYVPLVMNQINYVGLIDDLIDIKINLIKLNDEETIKVDDELFENLKFLNFSLIGLKLNKLARLIKNQYNSNPNDLDLIKIKGLIKNLSNLNKQQDLIKKHTNISEHLLNKIKFNGDNKFDEFEIFLNFENEIFTMTYKAQINKLNDFLLMNLNEKIIINCIILISIVNSGWKFKDFDGLKNSLMGNFGIEILNKLDNLLKFKLIKFQDMENDFTDNTNLDIHNSTYTLLNKFWSLHPEEPEEFEEEINDLNDYKSPNFTLPSNTIPLMIRIIESLFTREFLTYKPLNKITKQPSWENLSLNKMFKTPIIENKTNDYVDKSIIMFLGGITYSEISCINYLNSKLKSKGHKLFIISNGIIKNSNLQQFLNE